jgi:hypothetical protein
MRLSEPSAIAEQCDDKAKGPVIPFSYNAPVGRRCFEQVQRRSPIALRPVGTGFSADWSECMT